MISKAVGSRAATLTEVAERAKINKVTASIVLSGGRGNTRVSDKTRERILKAAQELNYQPNALARSLRSRKSHIIGLYMGGFIDMRNPFMSEIVSGIQRGCEKNQHDFLVHGTFRGDSIDDIYPELVNGKVDGLVIFTGRHRALVEKLAESHLPFVTIADPHPGLSTVMVDDIMGSTLLAKYLYAKGHRHVLYGTSPWELTSAQRRHDAFCVTAREMGMKVDSRVAMDGSAEISPLERDFINWPKESRPTAIACWNDELAYLMISFLQRQGLRIPTDIALVGFDGWQSIIPQALTLTTIRAPWRDVASSAVDILVNQSDRPIPSDVVLPVELIIGDSA